MHSSISNFKFFVGTALITVAAFLSYNQFVDYAPLKYTPHFENPKQDWEAKFERLSGEKDTKVFLVGTSLANAIPESYMPDGARVLGLSGGSSDTVLEMFKKAEIKPKVVFIEMNVFHRWADPTFLSKIDGLSTQLSFKIPALRTQNKPIAYIRGSISDRQSAKAKNLSSICGVPEEKSQWVSARSRVIQSWNQPRDEAAMDLHTEKLKQNIDELRKGGTQVYLVKFPIHPDMSETAYFKQVLQKRLRFFPNDMYDWIEIPNNELVWYDGIHMEKASSYKFLDRLFNTKIVRDVLGDVSLESVCVD